jgi:hypothetical protein
MCGGGVWGRRRVAVPDAVKRLYCLLAGRLHDVGAAVLPWDKALGLHMWYSLYPTAPLADVVTRYCQAVEVYVGMRARFPVCCPGIGNTSPPTPPLTHTWPPVTPLSRALGAGCVCAHCCAPAGEVPCAACAVPCRDCCTCTAHVEKCVLLLAFVRRMQECAP